ncbi:type II toxin-antitoxin system VapC family toxin [Leptolyngbya sp. AN03gr2]|uniref:type II toxin-antitoxin system VapC family toxin n=1 Tax=unclassified Leptolyngbya TaxID=2650499 RepID=UPI003D320DA0
MTTTLIDTNVLLDIFNEDPNWFAWSLQQLTLCANQGFLAINPIIYAEASINFEQPEELEAALPPTDFRRKPLPWEAAFLAGQSYLEYRRRGGNRRSPLPDFYIDAHAVVSDFRLLTRDGARYRTYFPSLQIIAPL